MLEGAPDHESQALDHAREVLVANCEGLLRFDEQSVVLKFVIDPEDGRLTAAVPVAVLMAAEHVLFVPEETEDALQLLVSPEEAQEGNTTDRWQAYHGVPEHVRWATFWIDGARHGPWVFDGDAMTAGNPLAKAEPALCKLANADPAKLARACKKIVDVDVPDPVCVGVDPGGMHVRARFGVVRLAFSPAASDADHAKASIEAMLAG